MKIPSFNEWLKVILTAPSNRNIEWDWNMFQWYKISIRKHENI